MTPKQYWEDDPYLAKAYYEAHKLRIEQRNQELWLQGLYIYNAFETVMANAFRKKGAAAKKYLEKPIEMFPKQDDDNAAQKEREKAIASFEAMRKAWELKNGNH